MAGTQIETGYRLEAVTVRKLEFENDAFAFGDKVRPPNLVHSLLDLHAQSGMKTGLWHSAALPCSAACDWV